MMDYCGYFMLFIAVISTVSGCKDGRFGSDCSQVCNCYNKTEVCHNATGYCQSGCATGFYGSGCQTAGSVQIDGVIGTTVALGVLSIILLAVSVLSLVHGCKYYRLYQKQEETLRKQDYLEPANKVETSVYEELEK